MMKRVGEVERLCYFLFAKHKHVVTVLFLVRWQRWVEVIYDKVHRPGIPRLP
jgi:hypothetical protein